MPGTSVPDSSTPQLGCQLSATQHHLQMEFAMKMVGLAVTSRREIGPDRSKNNSVGPTHHIDDILYMRIEEVNVLMFFFNVLLLMVEE